MSIHHTTVYAAGGYELGTLMWGWTCDACPEGESGFGNATTAREDADSHEVTA